VTFWRYWSLNIHPIIKIRSKFSLSSVGAWCVLLCASLLIPGNSLAQIQTWAFEPIVISADIIEPATLTVQTDDSPTLLVLEFANGSERPLNYQGDGLYNISVSHEEALFDYQSDDVNRNFVGFLSVYSGDTRMLKLNLFINVDDKLIPETIITDLTANIRLSSHLVNIRVTDVDIKSSILDITNLFYEHFPDDFDFLNIVSTPALLSNRFYSRIQNSVEGTGVPIFDGSKSYGSAGRLLGYVRIPSPMFFDLASRSYKHEIGHHWINFSNSPKLQEVKPHWPIGSLATGVMGWQITGQGLQFPWEIIKLPDDQYQLVWVGRRAISFYNDMELYLMGMISAADVGTFIVFENQDQKIPPLILEGPVVDFSVSDIIDSEGERIPAFPKAQVDFRVATIMASKSRLLTLREMKFFNHFAARGEATEELPYAEGFDKGTTVPFSDATKGVGSLSTIISFRHLETIYKNGFE